MCWGKDLLHWVRRRGAGRGKAQSAIARLAPLPLPLVSIKDLGAREKMTTPRARTRALTLSDSPRRGVGS